jgi:hypothetical protein
MIWLAPCGVFRHILNHHDVTVTGIARLDRAHKEGAWSCSVQAAHSTVAHKKGLQG